MSSAPLQQSLYSDVEERIAPSPSASSLSLSSSSSSSACLSQTRIQHDGGNRTLDKSLEEQHHQNEDNINDNSDNAKHQTDDDDEWGFCKDMKYDVQNRLVPFYAHDWSRPQNIFTVINATIFAFVIQLIPSLIFAELMKRETDGHMATAEVLLSTGIVGVIYAIFSGQPLVILGITGPVAILLGTSYGLTAKFNADYFPFFFWTCLWAGIMHMLTSAVGLVQLVWTVTPFTSQIFELFIAVTFIYSSLKDLISPLQLAQSGTNVQGENGRSTQYATLIIGLVTFYIAWTLHFAEQWKFFSRKVRVFLASYNTLLACVISTALSYLPGIDQKDADGNVGGIERVAVKAPWDWQPTWDRPWITNPLQGIDARGIFGAIVPGFMFYLLFIIDHNVSSILTQNPKFKLKKPSAYHWDFFVLGVTFIPCAIMGLPPGNGLIPQAPLHARALCTRKYEKDSHGVTHEIVVHCEEQRWSGLGQALLMFVALSLFEVISWIPSGTLLGLFFYLGIGALHGNEIWERVLLCFMAEKNRPYIPVVTGVEKWRTTQLYTLVQLLCVFAIFGVAQFATVGYIYPALLAALVPLRYYVLSRLFAEEDLKHLDPFGETEEDYFNEQLEIRRAERTPSMDIDDSLFARRAAFRGAGVARQLDTVAEKLRQRPNLMEDEKTVEELTSVIESLKNVL